MPASRAMPLPAGVLVVLSLLVAVSPASAQKPAADNRADAYDRAKVGELGDGRIVVPTNQVLSPLGKQVAYGGRPTDLALSPDGRWLAVLDRSGVLMVDPVAGKIVDAAPQKAGGYAGLVFTPDGQRLLASSFTGTIGVFAVDDEGELEAKKPIQLNTADGASGEAILPVGLAIDRAGKSLWAVLNLRNSLAEIDLETGTLRHEIPVGNAPFGVALVGGTAYVSNWAGRKPEGDVPTGPSGRGVRVRVDAVRHIASDGSVSVVDLAARREVKQIVVGLHPSAMVATPDGAHVIVANANSDTVSIIATRNNEVVETISTRPSEKSLFGSAPTRWP